MKSKNALLIWAALAMFWCRPLAAQDASSAAATSDPPTEETISVISEPGDTIEAPPESTPAETTAEEAPPAEMAPDEKEVAVESESGEEAESLSGAETLDSVPIATNKDETDETIQQPVVPEDVSEVAQSLDASQEVMPLIVVDNAPLQDAIKTLARQAQINFMFDPRITAGLDRNGQPVVHPDISLRFENVTAYQALEAVLKNYDMQLIPDNKTKIARITYTNPQALPALYTEVIQLKYAATTNMVNVIQPTISERSQVIPDSRTSKLIVVATDEELEKIHALLEQLDLPPRQVLIEANILETSKNPKTVKGIDWSGTFEAQNISFGNGHTTGTITTPGGTETTTVTLPSGRTVESTRERQSAESLLTSIGNGGLSLDTARGFHPATAFLNADGVHAVLSFLNKQNDTKVVATPRAVTLDNETARLEVTRAFPILEVTPGSANSPAGSSITYTNLGTILNVTPRISANSNIALKVIPEVSNIDSKDRQIINGELNEANIYAIRKISTHVVIPSGHTLVMGGLINDTINKGYTKVPVLGDIPGVGRLFRSDSKERNRQNLLVFITPTIVGNEDFQPTESTFLATRQEQPPPEELLTPWDSAKPYNWREQFWNEPVEE